MQIDPIIATPPNPIENKSSINQEENNNAKSTINTKVEIQAYPTLLFPLPTKYEQPSTSSPLTFHQIQWFMHNHQIHQTTNLNRGWN